MPPDRPPPASSSTELDESVKTAGSGNTWWPGFPVLVPGQRFSREILEFLSSLDTPEVHGYRPALGYRVFTDDAIAALTNGASSNLALP